MKRSEMIQIMKIASATGPSAVNMENYLGNILDKMQRAGMLAPIDDSYKEFFAKELGYSNWDHYRSMNGYEEPINGWEKE